jgi:hypothetical protein
MQNWRIVARLHMEKEKKKKKEGKGMKGSIVN